MVEQERIHFLNEGETRRDGEVVLYWMQQSQRAEYNHALEYAVFRANQLDLPLVVIFALVDNFPEANLRHYAFMAEGLAETGVALAKRGIPLQIRKGEPGVVLPPAVRDLKAALLVTDRGYLNVQRKWRREVAEAVSVQMVEVESDVIVPVETASEKEEYAARTLRPKLNRHLDYFLRPFSQITLSEKFTGRDCKRIAGEGLDWSSSEILLAGLKIDRSVARSPWRGGRTQALRRLKLFCRRDLQTYARERNLPTREVLSGMSPYLHFGQISALEAALTVRKYLAGSLREPVEAYLEELIVRRELAMNFCHFNPGYDSYQRAVPRWARESLEKHAGDVRPFLYSLKELERAATEDEIWNACQLEMTRSGKMHGYMRMYWGKKIIEWSETPEEAFKRMLYLNNKYELDGRDPNSFAGVAWCFGKHDRPWGPERPVFGLVRYMNEAGIRRKIKDWPDYVRKWYNK
jgi:deoxyribodipyrimidine photo-lyase